MIPCFPECMCVSDTSWNLDNSFLGEYPEIKKNGVESCHGSNCINWTKQEHISDQTRSRMEKWRRRSSSKTKKGVHEYKG